METPAPPNKMGSPVSGSNLKALPGYNLYDGIIWTGYHIPVHFSRGLYKGALYGYLRKQGGRMYVKIRALASGQEARVEQR